MFRLFMQQSLLLTYSFRGSCVNIRLWCWESQETSCGKITDKTRHVLDATGWGGAELCHRHIAVLLKYLQHPFLEYLSCCWWRGWYFCKNMKLKFHFEGDSNHSWKREGGSNAGSQTLLCWPLCSWPQGPGCLGHISLRCLPASSKQGLLLCLVEQP